MATRILYLIIISVGILMWVMVYTWNPRPNNKPESSQARTCDNGYFLYRNRQTEKSLSLSYTAWKEPGKPFHSPTWPELESLDLEPKRGFVDLDLTTVQEDVVFVTGSSENHFKESVAAVATARTLKPDWKVLYYDLGLNYLQVQEVKTWCNVDYRVFNYIRYPPHINNLFNYVWKIQIIADVLKTHNGLLWFDASIRFTNDSFTLQTALKRSIENGGFTMLSCTRVSVLATTHPMMYSYLPTRRSRLAEVNTCQGGALLIYTTEEVFYDILWPLYLCSLQKWCIAPNRDLYCDPEKLKRRNVYAKCHRYDMSAMNVLLLNKWRFDAACYRIEEEMVTVDRGGDSEGYKVPTCTA